MRPFFRIVLTDISLAGLSLFFCSPISTDPLSGEDPTLFSLSLERKGRTTAEFSGAPIEALIELDRDTAFRHLRWHTGRGNFAPCPEDVIDSVGKSFSALLFWTKYPLYRDTVDDSYYDTVWVSMGGGFKKSNKVVVKVTNLPVIMDSASFDTLPLSGQDTVWRCSLTTPVKQSYTLRLFARDPESRELTVQFFGNRGRIVREGLSSTVMEYLPPPGDFVDSVTILTSDQMRGEILRTIVIAYTAPNHPPSIDSLRVNGVMLKYAGGVMYRIGFPALDTLRLLLFAHDTLGTIERVVWKSRKNSVEADSSNPLAAVWECTMSGCGDTLEDSAAVMDTVTVLVIDDRGDSTIRGVEISRGKIDEAPSVEEMRFDGSEILFSDSVGTVHTSGGVLYTITVIASDPEGEKVAVRWAASSGILSMITDSSVRYRAPELNDTDTVSISVSDGSSEIGRIVRIIVDDIGPIFDSIRAGDTVFKGDDTVFTMEVDPLDTLLCIAYARDRDTLDSLVYTWSAGKPDRFAVVLNNRVRYVLPGSDLHDTITMTAQDGPVQIVRKVVCVPVNTAPAIDSIHGDGVALEGKGAFLRDTALAGYTVRFEVFAHDPEEDEISYGWSSANAGVMNGNEKTMDYACNDSSYVDTISVEVGDEAGKMAVRKVILHVNTQEEP